MADKNYRLDFELSDGSTKSVQFTAPQGEKGDTGDGPLPSTNGVVVTYQASSSGTTAPTGDWTEAIPSVSAGQYLWARTVTTYTSGRVNTVYNVSKMGETGEKGEKGDTGATGATGAAGADGVSVSKVEQTATSSDDGGSNVITVTLSNGNTSTFTVKNGTKGSTGATGAQGAKGATGATGAQGVGISGITITEV